MANTLYLTISLDKDCSTNVDLPDNVGHLSLVYKGGNQEQTASRTSKRPTEILYKDEENISERSEASYRVYDREKISKLLTKEFTAKQLIEFCQRESSFRAIYNQVFEMREISEIVKRIDDYAISQEEVQTLLDWAKKMNPSKYNHYEPYFKQPRSSPFQKRPDPSLYGYLDNKGDEPVDLEKRLKEHSLNQELDLYQRLQRVEETAKEIWKERRLFWFTDHGVAHSKRIIDHLGLILSDLQETRRKLTPHELYILLAACYLHDIGMQDFRIDGRGMEDFTVKDYDLIRQRHPERATELIIQRTIRRELDNFHIDLDDDDYLTPIALVCRGHGSKYFEDTVEELRATSYSPDGRPFRGDLLTSLLMIGDELDLHERRAKFPEEMNQSPVSALHHHIHHYVIGVGVRSGSVSKERQIYLSMQFPAESEDLDYPIWIEEWLTKKLQRQIKRTTKIIEKTTDGELKLSEEIIIRRSFDPYKRRRELPKPAQEFLKDELGR